MSTTEEVNGREIEICDFCHHVEKLHIKEPRESENGKGGKYIAFGCMSIGNGRINRKLEGAEHPLVCECTKFV